MTVNCFLTKFVRDNSTFNIIVLSPYVQENQLSVITHQRHGLVHGAISDFLINVAYEGHQACKKTEWWGAGIVICLERDADLHIAQLMPLPLTVSCFSKIQIGLTFLVPAHLGSPRQRAVKRVCVCYQCCILSNSMDWTCQHHSTTTSDYGAYFSYIVR